MIKLKTTEITQFYYYRQRLLVNGWPASPVVDTKEVARPFYETCGVGGQQQQQPIDEN